MLEMTLISMSPFLDSLCAYLGHLDVFEKVYKNSFVPSTTELIDFCSGNYFLGHNFFDGSKQKLRIHLYCDDIEVCNP